MILVARYVLKLFWIIAIVNDPGTDSLKKKGKVSVTYKDKGL